MDNTANTTNTVNTVNTVAAIASTSASVMHSPSPAREDVEVDHRLTPMIVWMKLIKYDEVGIAITSCDL